MKVRRLAPLALAFPLGLWAAAPAYAAQDGVFQANLGSVNDSGATGTAWVETHGGEAHITLNVSGAVADAPHAQHIHIGGQGTCPTAEADENGDGIVSTVEGQPAYGSIKVSLTTKGDSGPDSGLAVERMPTGASYTYERTVDVSDQVARDIQAGKASVIVHGIDADGSGKYDGEAKSELNEDLPLEATAPAACGELSAAPAGGMSTGGGGTAGDGVNGGLIGLGGALVLAAGGGVLASRRLRRDDR